MVCGGRPCRRGRFDELLWVLALGDLARQYRRAGFHRGIALPRGSGL